MNIEMGFLSLQQLLPISQGMNLRKHSERYDMLTVSVWIFFSYLFASLVPSISLEVWPMVQRIY
jgi:hypothetical protein